MMFAVGMDSRVVLGTHYPGKMPVTYPKLKDMLGNYKACSPWLSAFILWCT